MIIIINHDMTAQCMVNGEVSCDVTGNTYNSDFLDSTELLLPSATSWTTSAALPSPRGGLRGATLDNKVVVTGTNSDTLIIMRHDLFYK